MDKPHKIIIPEPCQEDWNKMTPKDNGRFCLSCTKTVVDFTKMLPEEVQQYFISNKNENICGKFKNTQLDEVIIQIPNRVLHSQTHYHKMFLLALFISMGTTLFSCSDKDGNKQKIDKVEVVDNSSRHTKVTMGIPVAPINELREVPSVYSIIYNQKDLDVLPVPENGMKKFHAFFNKNYTSPNKTKNQEEISILFVVERDGTLTNFNIVNNSSKESAEEAIRVLEKSPKWIPGKFKKRIVRSTYTLTFPFK